ncbi:MAG TPA: ADOP family duplicated permease [Gemmatimonadaceae bacterium]|nr:ADOP family duplicated permease [Gemmatimonadaceae bacterium]
MSRSCVARDAGGSDDRVAGGMSGRTAGWRRFFRLWRPSAEADIDAELRFHFEQKVADLIARGATPEVARSQAVAEFGDVDAVRSSLREIDGRIARHRQRAEWWEGVAQDVGYVLRTLRRSPGFTVTVAVTFALGIGANAAIFSLLDRMFMRAPAGVSNPGEIRRLQQHYRDQRRHTDGIRSVYNHAELRDLRAAAPEGVTLAGYRTDHERLGPDDDAPEGVAGFVEGDFFGVAGVRPAAGRFFTPDEDRIENFVELAVISQRYWMQRFGGDVGAIGQSVNIDARRYTIIGVAQAGFEGIDIEPVDFWVPMSTMRNYNPGGERWYDSPNSYFMRIITRARTRATALRVVASATPVIRTSKAIDDSASTVVLAPVIEAVWPDAGGKEVAIATRLAGVAAIILLIACANIANLLLARAFQRRREIAVRLALGVSRARLVGQLLTEIVVIALFGALVALVAATWGATALRNSVLPDVRWGEPAISPRIVAFATVIAIVAGVATGLVPALQASHTDLVNALKAGAREGTYRASKLRSALLVVQGALSVVLLAGSGLFVRSLQHIESVSLGYDADRLVFANVRSGAGQGSHREEVASALPIVAERLSRLPGVEGVGLVDRIPLWGFHWVKVFLPDRDSVPRLHGASPFMSWVSPDYFATVGIRVQGGRGLLATDREGAEPVIAVSALTAKTIWPGENAIKKCLILDKRDAPCRTVVGIVSETHYAAIIEDPSMHIYIPLAQAGPAAYAGALAIRVRSTGSASTTNIIAKTRAQLGGILGRQSHVMVRPMSEILARELRPFRLGAELFTAAGLLALVVAAVGVYSTVAYNLSQRTQEMGVRVALGACGADIVRLVLGEGVRVVLVGVVIGCGMALALGRVVASMLYDTSPRDPAVIGVVSLVLVGVAAAACLVPAWRATRADPIAALRAE